MKESGIIVKKEDKVIYVFGKATVPYLDQWEDHSYIGINLDTGHVDDIRSNYVTEVPFSSLTDGQERQLSKAISTRQRLSKKVLTISALARAGKDTLANYIISKCKAAVVRSLADPIREIDFIVSGTVKGKNRESLILIGQGLRKEDPNIWIKVWLRRQIELLNKHGYIGGIIVADVRQPNEFTFFKSMGALTVKIEADEEKRLEKIREIDGEAAINEKLLNDETESHVGGFVADRWVYNDYTDTFIGTVDGDVISELNERGW